MAPLDLRDKLHPCSARAGVSARYPWDDPHIKRATRWIQEKLSRECPQLLEEGPLSAAARRELLSRIEDGLGGNLSLKHAELTLAGLAREIYNHISGMGPLQPFLERPDVSEIMVNRWDDIWIEVEGRIQRAAGVRFRDDLHVYYVAQRVMAPLGMELSAAHPLASGRLGGGVRVAASMPPVSTCTTLSVRKQTLTLIDTSEYLTRGSASPAMLTFLQAAIRGRANVLIAGPTGTGKSTLLRYLARSIDPAVRVLVLEQVAELGLERFHPHVVSLETRRPAGQSGGLSMDELLHHALHRRPDYIIVGEVLGPEALPLLLAMATGHPGASTVHAQSPARLFDRLALAILQARLQIDNEQVLRYLAQAVDLVAYIERMVDGSRKVTMISEITGFASGSPVLHDLYRFHPTHSDGHRVCGQFDQVGAPTPALLAKLARWGA